MNIAVIGSSPIMVLMAYKLSKTNNVTIFEKSKNYGGAWSWEKHFGINIPTKTNVFEPTNIKEEIFLKEIIKFFQSEFKIKPKRIDGSYNKHLDYHPKNLYEFDIIKIYKKIFSNNKIKIIKKKISSVNLKKKVKINKKYIFDKLYVPFFFGIKEFYIHNKKIKTDYKLITSKHLFMVSKSRFFKKFYYSVNLNNFFDRAQIQKKNNLFFFKARIRKKYKKYPTSKLIKNCIKKNFLNKVKTAKIIKYSNYYRNHDQIKKLEKIVKKNKIYVLDTRQLVTSFFKYKLHL